MGFLAVHNGVLTVNSVAIPFLSVNENDINNLITTTNASSGGALDTIAGIHEAELSFECLFDDAAVISNGTNLVRSGLACTATWQVGTGHTSSFTGRIANVGKAGTIGDAVKFSVSAKGKITAYAS